VAGLASFCDLNRFKPSQQKHFAVATPVVPPVIQLISKQSYVAYVTAMADCTENGRVVLHSQKCCK